jgi:glycosyltransferase involved in cell wall biosynthesis
MRRLHVISLPHTTLTEQHSTCAYTMKHHRFCPMMLDQGCEVFSYGPDITDDYFRATEHVVITTQADRERWGFGEGFNTAGTPFEWDAALPYWQEPAVKAIDAIRERMRERDYLCLITGTQQPIGQAISGDDCRRGPLCVEYGIGYEGFWSPFSAFESYAWMHHVYGLRRITDGPAYHQVIPNFFEPAQFYLAEPGDYLLYMGRVIQRKGVDIAAMIAERAGRKLIIAGPGAREWSKGRVVNYEGDEITGDLEYVGEVHFAERAELMAKAAAVLVPTKYIEPFGGVAVEAMLAGAPVVASDWGAFPELLSPASGRLFRTPKQGAAAVEEVVSLDRQAIRSYAITRFSLEAVGSMFMRWFDQLDTLWATGFFE